MHLFYRQAFEQKKWNLAQEFNCFPNLFVIEKARSFLYLIWDQMFLSHLMSIHNPQRRIRIKRYYLSETLFYPSLFVTPPHILGRPKLIKWYGQTKYTVLFNVRWSCTLEKIAYEKKNMFSRLRKNKKRSSNLKIQYWSTFNSGVQLL